ncbi:sulfotransferase [Arthrobacter sp. NEB 688]|uniref:sulfotransferase n=1 Tax=Arthrobacter sp. NEB 688 TaxID=904039 RepID=UPI001563EBC3|nr:sulfotransferase [Arthrobacter sp. NEB 688]QKE85802.1 sulfotransferase [Arthrobacter sp. NEB 688]
MSNVIGQLPGCLSVGEARYTWGRGAAANHLCGCGRPFSECPFWQDVMAEVGSGRPPLDAAGTAERIDARLRVRSVPAMELRRLRGRPEVLPHADDPVIADLYHALAARPGAERAVVDSSKLPPYARLLDGLPGVDVFLVHVVRDPRATAFSWRRSKATRDAADSARMPRISVVRSSVIWVLWNLMVPRWWPQERRMTVRYEDFVDDPAAELARIAQALGTTVPDGLVEGASIHLSPTHSVAGNPDRLDAGAVRVRRDDEWRTAMPMVQRWAVTALCLPGLRRFGYRVRAR